jgi:hypothetical protein
LPLLPTNQTRPPQGSASNLPGAGPILSLLKLPTALLQVFRYLASAHLAHHPYFRTEARPLGILSPCRKSGECTDALGQLRKTMNERQQGIFGSARRDEPRVG